MPTRRQFIRSAATGAVLGTLATGGATANHERSQPSDVTLEFDEADLETYQPYLETAHLDIEPTYQYALKATRPGEPDLYQYWTYYPTQRGIGIGDSHYLDREPVYVLVDGGDVTEIWYSGYHWIKATADGAALELYDGTHPTLRVAEKWHHYRHQPVSDAASEFVELRSLDDVWTKWLADGWEEDLRVGATRDPWTMDDAPDWWQHDGFNPDLLIARASLRFGIRGAGDTDF